MKRRTLTIALAALLAVIGTVAVLAYVHQANNRAVAGLRAETVIVAKAEIPAGTSLHDAEVSHALTTERVPIASVPADAVLSVTAKNDKLVLGSPIQAGQLVLEPMLETAAQVTGGVAIPPYDLAVTIQVCIPAAVAGYVTAGSQVAVFDTYPAQTQNSSTSLQQSCNGTHQAQLNGAAATRIVLPRVPVLSVSTGPSAQAASSGGAFAVSSSSSTAVTNGMVMVTLAVDQADAERLIQITEVGLPYLALLTPSSKTSFDSGPVPLFQSGS